MEEKQQFGRFYDLIQRSHRLLLIAHQRPDGDTMGATTAFLHWCLDEGKDVTAFCVDTPPEMFRYLQGAHRYTNDPSVFDRAYDLVIAFDSGDLLYAGVEAHMERLPEGHTLVNIDHHNTNREYGDLNIVLYISSTSEVIYRFFKANKLPINEHMATCLLTGLCTDTSNFSNPATSQTALEAAGELIAAGGRFYDVLQNIWHDKSLDILNIWGKVLRRLKHIKAHGVVASYLKPEEHQEHSSEVTKAMVNFLCAVVSDANVILLLKENEDGTVKGSYRSTVRDVSVSARMLGGGGHKLAAGFTVEGQLQFDDTGFPHVIQQDRTIMPTLIVE